MSEPIKVYHDNLTQPSRALYLFLKINQIPFESIVVTLRSGEHTTDEFRRHINRFGKIPCINDNGFRLAETPAILQYLVAKHPDRVADHWYPLHGDVQARARIDEYISWHPTNVRAHLTDYFWNQWAMPRMIGGRCEERLAMARVHMETTLDFLEKQFLQDGRFIAGGRRISIADLLAVSELMQLRLTDYDICRGRPKIERYIEMVRQATEPHFQDTFQILHKVAKITHSKSKM